MVLFGGVYHVLVWGIGRTVFPHQAEGSLIRGADGAVLGSRLIAQKFTRPQYLHSRPSAVDYNAASTGGSNHGPSHPEHRTQVRTRLDAVVAAQGVPPSAVPSELVTASGGGLDPHLPPNAIDLQISRVAAARHADPERIRAIVQAHIESPFLGVFGRARINVLEVNLALDKQLGDRHDR